MGCDRRAPTRERLQIREDQIRDRLRSGAGPAAFSDYHRRAERLDLRAAISIALHDGALPGAGAGKTGTGELTTRESEIAEFVALGLTNKQIASKLVIAPRTAEAHVQNILTKLGFNSRAQIAAWVTTHSSQRS